jgi:hypothetical protein
MGASFSSNRLQGGVESGVPSVSYAYASGNTNLLGADATFRCEVFPPLGVTSCPAGLITPYLVQPSAAATITCSPFSVGYYASASLQCPVSGVSLASGLYTLSFLQYTTTSSFDPAGSTTVYYKAPGPNTLTDFGGDYTFSVVKPTTTVAVTPVCFIPKY